MEARCGKWESSITTQNSTSSPDKVNSADQLHWEDWELRHLAKRAGQFGLSREQAHLNEIGWDARGDSIDPRVINGVEEVLRRLAGIPAIDSTCSKPSCSVCRKLISVYSDSEEAKLPGQLRVEPYRWQKEAAEAWLTANGRGIVKVVTGAGKTVLALLLVSRLRASRAYRDTSLRVVIVVPTTALLDQWYEGVISLLSLEDRDVGVFYGEKKQPLTDQPVTIYVLPSAARHLARHVRELEQGEDLFLIVDECHRSGSPKFSKIYKADPAFTLGLSATPERRADFAFEEILVPALGPIIYEYGYSEARSDGIIPPFRLKRIGVKLKRGEQEKYNELSDDISELFVRLISKYPQLQAATGEMFLKVLGSLQRTTEDMLIEQYTILLNLRKEIVHTSRSKMQALTWIIENELPSSTKTLIFHERIASANQIHEYLASNGHSAALYHSEMPIEDRKGNLSAYREGSARLLVACTALDEGLDVPATSAGIIVAATSSIRQHIQRIGRILRRAPGKDHSLVYTIYVEGIEDDIYSDRVMKELQRAAERVEYIALT